MVDFARHSNAVFAILHTNKTHFLQLSNTGRTHVNFLFGFIFIFRSFLYVHKKNEKKIVITKFRSFFSFP